MKEIMKILVICLSFFMYGCGGGATTTKQDTVPAQQANKTRTLSSAPAVAAAATGFASPEAIAETETPIYGNDADFTIKMMGAQPGVSDLIGFYAEQNFKIDTTFIQADGSIRFQRKGGYPQGFYYLSFAKERYLQIILGEDQQFVMESNIANPDGDMKVIGSDENQAFFENLKFEKIGSPKFTQVGNALKAEKEGSPKFKELKAQQKALVDERKAHLQELYKKYPNTLFAKFKEAGQNPDLREDVPQESVVYHYRQEFWDNVDFSDRRLLRTQVINNKLKRYFQELTPQNQDSIFSSAESLCERLYMYPEYFRFVTVWVLNNYEPNKTTLMDPEKVFVRMIQKFFTHDKAFWADSLEVFALQQRSGEMANSLIGDKGPNVISKDLQGKTHTLFDSKAEYLIVYMFTPTCEHCQEETPKLVEWYNEWHKEGVDVYAIALDTNEKELGDYIKKTKMPFSCVWDPTNRSIYAKYYVDITPEIYVLDRDRKIIGRNLKVFQIETIINLDKEKSNKK